MRLAPLLLVLAACPEPELQYWRTCGDPVCSGYTAPSGIPVCADETEGATCTDRGALCAIDGDTCNVRLVCAVDDPTQGPEGCPISRASAKSDIRYVDPAERAALARQLHDIRLTTWRYTADPKRTSRLGFLLDDAPPAPTVLPHGERVDLYGTTSLTIAAIQEQQATIEALRAEVATLRAELDALRSARDAR